MIKLSILVPVYNVASYLCQCMDSIIRQTYTNLEIICIDDGSTDKSNHILDEYAERDNRIKVVHKKNTGYGHSMNLGLRMATGDYIGIVESDDYIATDMFEKLAKVIEEEKAELDVVKASYYEFTEYGYKRKKSLQAEKCGHVMSPRKYIELFWINCSLWSGVYRRDFLIRNDIKFLETPGASYQDTAFYFKVLATAKNIYLLEDALVFYRIDNEGSSVNAHGKIFCVCDEVKEIERYMDKYNLHSPFLDAIKNAYIYRTYIWNYYRLHMGLRSAFLGELVRGVREIAASSHLRREYWDDWNWKGFQSILSDPENFFWESNWDLKCLEFDQYTIKDVVYHGALIEYLKKQERIIIYGAGVYGRRVLEFLGRCGLRKRIVCFAVTSGEDNLDTIEGISVYPIDKLLRWYTEATIIVAVTEKAQQEILRLLKNLEFSKVIRVDKVFAELLYRESNI